MKIAVLSDIHDNIWNLEKVIKYLEGKIEAVIYCGDFCAGFTSRALGEVGIPIYACLGNNDEDHINNLQKGGENYCWTPLAKEFGQVELGGRKISFCHYPKLAELLAKSGEYNAVFHGHTHVAFHRQAGDVLLANPGAVCGIQQGNPGEASFGIYDTDTNEIELFDLAKL